MVHSHRISACDGPRRLGRSRWEAELTPMQTRKGVMVMSEDIKKIINYISEREANLSRYSDKLRKSVTAVANVFGDADECQVCGFSRLWGDHGKYRIRYSHQVTDTLPEKIQGLKVKVVSSNYKKGRWAEGEYAFVEEVENQHKFTPKVEVSIDFQDEISFYQAEDGDTYFLAFKDHQLVANIVFSEYEADVRELAEISREALKALVRSGRLIDFLKLAAEKLAEAEQEYKQVAEVAEKLAKAVQP